MSENPEPIDATATQLAEQITEAFALATKAAVERLRAAGIPTVGRDADGNIVRRTTDGVRTIVVPAKRGGSSE